MILIYFTFSFYHLYSYIIHRISVKRFSSIQKISPLSVPSVKHGSIKPTFKASFELLKAESVVNVIFLKFVSFGNHHNHLKNLINVVWKWYEGTSKPAFYQNIYFCMTSLHKVLSMLGWRFCLIRVSRLTRTIDPLPSGWTRACAVGSIRFCAVLTRGFTF